MLSYAGFCAINDTELLIFGGLNEVNKHQGRAFLIDTNTFIVSELHADGITFGYWCPDNQHVVINRNHILAKVDHGRYQMEVRHIDLRALTREQV